MLGLPKTTETAKQLPKKAIYAKFNMNSAQKERFDSDISRITIVNEVNPTTARIKVGENIKGFYVLSVLLKSKDFDDKTIIQLSKLIPQNILFALVYEDECKLAVYHSKLMQSEWKPLDEHKVDLSGTTLDMVWDNIIVQIGEVKIEEGHSLEEQIALDEQRKKLQKEIDRLEAQARKEKQPKKKFELAEQIKALQKQMEVLGTTPLVIKDVAPTTKAAPEKKEVPTASGNTVKALSVLAPYAMDIFDGLKTIEWRSWKTDYRGDLLICSSSRKFEGCISGHALCMVELVDVVPFTKSHLANACMEEIPEPAGYAWILKNVRHIVPFAYKGKLHLYDVDASLVKVLSPIHTPDGDTEYEKYYRPLVIAAGGY